MKKRFLFFISVIGSLYVLSACSFSFFEKEEPVKEEPLPKCLTHVVQFGDTLAGIARWYTGDVDNWQKIAAANPDISERSMPVGVEVCVPYEIVSNFEPLSRSKVTNNVQKKISDPVKKDIANKKNQQKQISFDELKAEVKQETIDAETAVVRESLGFGQDASQVEQDRFDNRNDNIFEEYIYDEPNQDEGDSLDNNNEDDEEDELSKARSELLREMLQDE